ncbi:hypothetical protein, partial [Arthrobacter sp. Hiyo1]|uniref:hypothetical protein n=1 Tax=Arthrobacter sp. Hiyo1 TaxID=1588020 RepID=UPI000B227889
MTYTIHSLTGLGDAASFGLPAETNGAGILRATVNETGQRATFIVDAEYSQMILAAKETLGDDAVLSATAVRWLRLGWPEDWGTNPEPEAWAPAYRAG